MKRQRPWIASILSVLLICGTVLLPVYADEDPMPAAASGSDEAELTAGTETGDLSVDAGETVLPGGDGPEVVSQDPDGARDEDMEVTPEITPETTPEITPETAQETGEEGTVQGDTSEVIPVSEPVLPAETAAEEAEDRTAEEDAGKKVSEEGQKAEENKEETENGEEEAEEAEESEELEEAAPVTVEYHTHIQNVGWESSWKTNDMTSGTTGRSLRLEGIQIRLKDAGKDDYIEYRTHVQNIGWESSWKKNGETSGTTGRSLRLEAIQIRLSPALAEKYDIYYCVHAQDYGWLDWSRNGDAAGTEGHSKRLEAIRIQVVPKGSGKPAPAGSTQDVSFLSYMLRYQAHVQDYGWRSWVTDGKTGGTTGQSKRVEGIRIEYYPNAYSGNISGGVEYRTHIQNIGWESSWKKDGELSGTTGKSLRLEAIQIRLTGDAAGKYDVYYRSHIQDFGWLGWAKNGETSGSEGLGKRMEAIQIMVVPFGSGFSGATSGAVRKSMNKWNVPYAQPNNGNRTIYNLLRTALVPCGRTLWVWGGGHGPDTNIMGMPQSWVNYFTSHSTPDYHGDMDTVTFWNGPDCSGYMNWVLANTAYTTSNRTGLSLMAEDIARVYSSYGWTRLSGPGDQVYKPGDIVCMDYGHVWICLGQYDDGSVILVHNSTKGVQISGTGGIAHQRAGYYMKKYFPYWPYGAMLVDWYKGFMNKGRWITNGSGLLTDPQGIQNMKPDQVLQLLLGD